MENSRDPAQDIACVRQKSGFRSVGAFVSKTVVLFNCLHISLVLFLLK